MRRQSEASLNKQPSEPLVEFDDVSKCFAFRHESQRSFQDTFIRLIQRRKQQARTFWPLRHVSLTVNRGDSFGIIGRNGSGKSTLLKLISGILMPTSGRITTRGRIASLLELGAGFHPELTGRENIFLNGSVYGLSRRQIQGRLEQIIDFAQLGEFIDVPIKHYSSGMYVRLGFAVAIHVDPDLLLVDEVLAVGDAAFQMKCIDSIQAFRDQGGTLVFVTHDLATVQRLCNRAAWLDDGQIKAQGQPTDVVMTYRGEVAAAQEAVDRAAALPSLGHGARWGNGKVQITRVKLCDSAGVERALFSTGCPMQIQLYYRSDQPIRDPIFGLAIHHQSGTHICGPNSDFGGLHIPVAHGEGVVTYHIPSLSLLEGSYVLSVSSHNRSDTELYDYHDRAYPFRVQPGTSREIYGLVTLNGEWGFESPATVSTL